MPLPPGNRIPRNLDMRVIEVEQYTVGSWCPAANGQGPATQVHLLVELKGRNPPFVLRLKTPEAVDTLIAFLKRHRSDVWPHHKTKGQ